jgi:hypothetical protein
LPHHARQQGGFLPYKQPKRLETSSINILSHKESHVHNQHPTLPHLDNPPKHTTTTNPHKYHLTTYPTRENLTIQQCVNELANIGRTAKIEAHKSTSKQMAIIIKNTITKYKSMFDTYWAHLS